MQLLIEYLPLNYTESLTENTADGKIVLHHVLLQKADAKNQNGRVYPKDILFREVKKYEKLIKERRATGELDHPESPTINLKNVSHNITNIIIEGDGVYGDIEVLSTPSGNIVKELIRNNIRLGVSSRGLGSLRNIGEDLEVQPDFNLICWDIVSNPSTNGAFINESANPNLISTPLSRIDGLIHELLTEINS